MVFACSNDALETSDQAHACWDSPPKQDLCLAAGQDSPDRRMAAIHLTSSLFASVTV